MIQSFQDTSDRSDTYIGPRARCTNPNDTAIQSLRNIFQLIVIFSGQKIDEEMRCIE